MFAVLNVPNSKTSKDDQRSRLLNATLERTINPVNGAVGLLWTANWHVCQSAVETVLRGGVPRPLPEFTLLTQSPEFDEGSEGNNEDLYGSKELNVRLKRKSNDIDETSCLDLGLAASLPPRMTARGGVNRRREKRRPASPSDESETTTFESCFVFDQDLQKNNEHETKLLKLFF
ncbi:hypothetical protein BUALT_Bualt15G0048600 [Buddleja alternifolia]|uniref:LOB domain-containing protein n=1 Tax=Buddleja alternifolia TaxID=168488 RepID=A0AAV6WEF3_9LAMI|nr:hypothetical protein BUALT_Bualt15G0048600 [Buddleja alternifolia]